MPRCKVCKEKFEAKFFNQKSCFNPKCIIEFNEMTQRNKWKKRKKDLREKLKTNSDFRKDLQVLVNSFVRLRDKEKSCISCNRKLNAKYDAGHYRSQGGNPELRFNEDNIHAQCVRCNRDLHGNLIDYRINLIKRIGIEKVEWLESKQDPKHYSIPELKEMIIEYKQKIKNINQ